MNPVIDLEKFEAEVFAACEQHKAAGWKLVHGRFGAEMHGECCALSAYDHGLLADKTGSEHIDPRDGFHGMTELEFWSWVDGFDGNGRRLGCSARFYESGKRVAEKLGLPTVA